MCCNPMPFLSAFVPIANLGDERDCFIIKTPSYNGAENEKNDSPRAQA